MPENTDTIKATPKRTYGNFEGQEIRPINSEGPKEIERILGERFPEESTQLFDRWCRKEKLSGQSP